MNIFLILGISLVNFAFIFYTIFIIKKRNKKIFSLGTIFVLLMGILLDISSTTFMIIGSQKSTLSFHGVIGYIALAGMMVDFGLILFYKKKKKEISKKLSTYTNSVYLWWLLVYIFGFIHVLGNH